MVQCQRLATSPTAVPRSRKAAERCFIMAKSKTSSVPAGRFQSQETSQEVARLGSCNLAPGRYVKPRDQYGFHFRRVLADGQTIDFTVAPSGILVEKVNFVPSKERRDGNAAYGNRWLGILEYRQSDDHAADLEFAAANGMKMQPPAAKAATSTGVWTVA